MTLWMHAVPPDSTQCSHDRVQGHLSKEIFENARFYKIRALTIKNPSKRFGKFVKYLKVIKIEQGLTGKGSWMTQRFGCKHRMTLGKFCATTKTCRLVVPRVWHQENHHGA